MVDREGEFQKNDAPPQGSSRQVVHVSNVTRYRDDVDDGGGDRETKVREWMYEAEKLVEGFRETRGLFLSSYVCQTHFNFLLHNLSN